MDFRERFHGQIKTALSDFTDAQRLEVPMLHDRWIPGRTYVLGDVIRHEETLYKVMQPEVTASKYQPPNGYGMLAVYRPIVLEATGGLDDPIPFILGMDVTNGLYYTYKDRKYLAKSDMMPCVWPPDSGIWQWELVPEEAIE